jgi:hypothetical protein
MPHAWPAPGAVWLRAACPSALLPRPSPRRAARAGSGPLSVLCSLPPQSALAAACPSGAARLSPPPSLRAEAPCAAGSRPRASGRAALLARAAAAQAHFNITLEGWPLKPTAPGAAGAAGPACLGTPPGFLPLNKAQHRPHLSMNPAPFLCALGGAAAAQALAASPWPSRAPPCAPARRSARATRQHQPHPPQAAPLSLALCFALCAPPRFHAGLPAWQRRAPGARAPGGRAPLPPSLPWPCRRLRARRPGAHGPC